MVKNERGSTLHVVLLMLLIFTILGLTILSASIGGANRTEIRKDEVVDNLAEIKHLNEAVAYIQAKIDQEYTSDMTMAKYNEVIKEIDDNENYSIDNVTPNSIDSTKYFTRIFQVTSQHYKKNVYITGMPSFLKYAIGSREHLTLNGSVYIKEGNLYANTGLTISNTAKYVYNKNNLTVDTSLPSVFNTNESFLFLSQDLNPNNIEYCKDGGCYQGENRVVGKFQTLNLKDLSGAFNPTAPTYSTEKTEFVDVNILKTFYEKMKETGLDDNEIGSLIHTNEAINPVNNEVKKINKMTNEEDFNNHYKIIDNTVGTKGYLYQGSPAYIDSNDLKIDKSKWLIIDGDAYFENIGNTPMKISGNILITGNVTMKGDLSFDSTMYVLGNTTINNANINGIDGRELILMTEGTLELARFNKFNDPSPNYIKAYLYTTKSATIYAVGSLINIEGGLFAKGNLEINAFRGKTKNGSNDLQFTPDTNVESSRLIMKNNKKLFIDQEQGLPKVERLEVLTDLIEKK